MSLISFIFGDDDILVMPRACRRPNISVMSNFGLSDKDRFSKALFSGAATEQDVTVKNDSETFQVSMNVRGFNPDELKVQVQDRVVTVTGEHEERQDEHGYIARSFKRRFVIPEDVQMKNVTSNVTKDGMLSVTAPKSQPAAIEGPTPIQVEIVKE